MLLLFENIFFMPKLPAMLSMAFIKVHLRLVTFVKIHLHARPAVQLRSPEPKRPWIED